MNQDPARAAEAVTYADKQGGHNHVHPAATVACTVRPDRPRGSSVSVA